MKFPLFSFTQLPRIWQQKEQLALEVEYESIKWTQLSFKNTQHEAIGNW